MLGKTNTRYGELSKQWSREELMALLKIRLDMDDEFRWICVKDPLWEEISRALAWLGYKRSAKTCKKRFEDVVKFYKRTKDHHTSRQQQGVPVRSPVLLSSLSMASTSKLEIPQSQPMSLDNVSSSSFPKLESKVESDKISEEDTMITDEFHIGKSNPRGDDSKELMGFFEGFMKQVLERQEEKQQLFLEGLEKREAERMAREEAWRRQEMIRLSREHQQLTQERAAIISFLHRIGQTPSGVIPPTTQTFPWLQQPVPAVPSPKPENMETMQHDEASVNLHPSNSLTDEPPLNCAIPGTVESSTTQHPTACSVHIHRQYTPNSMQNSNMQQIHDSPSFASWMPDEFTADSLQNSTVQKIHDPRTLQYSASFASWMPDENSPSLNSCRQDEWFALETTIHDMYDLIELAECWLHKDAIANLLQEAKDTVCCTEDFLDKLSYYKLQEKAGFNANKSSCPEFSDIEMTEIHGNLSHLREQMGNLGLHDMQPQHFIFESFSQKQHRFTYKETIIGRQEELQVLMDSLILDKNSPTGGQVTEVPDSGRATQKNLSVLTIIGDGGIGKTALAHTSFHHQRVQDHFDLLVWISVSDGFDDKKLIKRLACSVAESEMNSDDLSCLQKVLTNGLIHHSMRLLLVLDDLQEDVCQEYYRGWERFLVPLKCARQGSTILVTTRSMKVAEHISTARLQLADLPEEISWHFFSMHAFDSPISDSDQAVECIGRTIAARLNGSPLGSKIIGCLLNLKVDAAYWKSILENIGLEYIDQLVRRSFFQIFPTSSGSRYVYVMQGLLYETAQEISINECFLIKDSSDLLRIPPKVRHLSILHFSGLSSSDLESLHKYKTLRSVVCISIDSNVLTTCVLETWFSHLTNIRMLRFISCQLAELPGNVCDLILLRYLDISSCKFEALPDSIWCLHKLEILDAQQCGFHGVPKDIVKLVNLRKLRLKDDLINQLGHVPGIEKLVYLQEMPYYAVGDTPGRGIQELKNLNDLRGALEVSRLHNVTSKEQAAKANLDKKIHLNTLVLSWHESTRPGKVNADQEMEVLEGLCPSPSMKNLEVRFYMGFGFHPSWLLNGKNDEPTSSRLESLSINSCPNITRLFITGAASTSTSSRGSSLEFKSLTKLCITWCRKLRNLDNLLEPEILPEIRMIQISNCEELESLPANRFSEFTHLEDLEVSHCWSLSWARGFTLPSSLKSLKLEACGELVDYKLSCCLRELPALATLELQFCSGMESIDAKVWSGMPSLRSLKIFCCQELSSFGGAESISKVEKVDIRYCPKLTELEQPFQRG
uniref:Myb-like domain-containing protein n=1 Tax=Leersia perrieri TaxID=77586 RepID=A0A0D9XD00_9ORYZ